MTSIRRWCFKFLFLPLAVFLLGCGVADVPAAAPSADDLIGTIIAVQTAAAASTLGADPDLLGRIIATQTVAAASTLTAAPTSTPTLYVLQPTSTFIYIPTAAAVIFPTSTRDTRPLPEDWREWNVTPEIGQTARQILHRGLLAGNDPHTFSKIGDCQSEPNIFLGIYDTNKWDLPKRYKSAQPAIGYFHGYFKIKNVTVGSGFEAASVLNPIFADARVCETTETPLACELRIRRPAVVLIALGTNQKLEAAERFEKHLRTVVATLIQRGSLPVLLTKPDNSEGNGAVNLAIAQAAYDYDLPLINIWKAFQKLPKQGLQTDQIYMASWSWDTRNLYALTTLEDLRQVIVELGY